MSLFTHWKDAWTGGRYDGLLVQDLGSGESNEHIDFPRISPNMTGKLFSLLVSQFPHL